MFCSRRQSLIRDFFNCMLEYDLDTAMHLSRVKDLATIFARDGLCLPPLLIQEISEGAVLHDIGKMVVPVKILNKLGSLTATEWQVIKKHPEYGANIVRRIPELRHLGEIILCHHEKYDGTGYPQGRAGADIPFAARVLMIVDVYEALTANRPYRLKLDANQALHILKNGKGAQFDPQLTDVFIRLIKEKSGKTIHDSCTREGLR